MEDSEREQLLAHIRRLTDLCAGLAEALASLSEVAQKATLRIKEMEQKQKGEN